MKGQKLTKKPSLDFAFLGFAPRLRSPRRCSLQLRSPRLHSGQAGQARQAQDRREKPVSSPLPAHWFSMRETAPFARRASRVHYPAYYFSKRNYACSLSNFLPKLPN